VMAASQSDFTGRPPLNAGTPVRLRDLGYDEIWLQNWLSEDPSRLGLGGVNVVAQELTQTHGGSLDILAADADTYYSIEVQLGEVDASHGFRVLDYWARNRERYPGKTHVAVLMAESTGGRYSAALHAIAEYLPLAVIELRAWQGGAEAVLVPEIVAANTSLDIGGTPAAAAAGGRTEADWEEECTPEAWAFHKAFVHWTQEHLGEIRVDYNPRSYIGVRRGRRVWGPLWPVRDGATVHLPDPDGSRDEPSVAFEDFRERLSALGLEPSWQASYNAGANPISLRLKKADLDRREVQDLLKASWEIIGDGATPWSERHPAARHGENDASALGQDAVADAGVISDS
jgi:hypothetical protein